MFFLLFFMSYLLDFHFIFFHFSLCVYLLFFFIDLRYLIHRNFIDSGTYTVYIYNDLVYGYFSELNLLISTYFFHSVDFIKTTFVHIESTTELINVESLRKVSQVKKMCSRTSMKIKYLNIFRTRIRAL